MVELNLVPVDEAEDFGSGLEVAPALRHQFEEDTHGAVFQRRIVEATDKREAAGVAHRIRHRQHTQHDGLPATHAADESGVALWAGEEALLHVRYLVESASEVAVATQLPSLLLARHHILPKLV